MIYGAQIDYSTKKSRIQELLNENQEKRGVVIQGEVFGYETRAVKNDKVLHKGALYDGTNSLYFQFFASQNVPVSLSDGKGVLMQGDLTFNQYAGGELTLFVQAINPADTSFLHNVREDRAPQKRVELSRRTQMSSKDGVENYKEVIDSAVKMGYKEVFITDWVSVQAIPEAYHYAHEKGVALRYGATLNIIEQNNRVVIAEHETDSTRSLNGLTIVSTDVETMGFAVLGDEPRDIRLIELGAVKGQVVDGVFVESDRLSILIRPNKPLPSAITELTGITQDMLDGKTELGNGVSIATAKDAMLQFEAFRQGAVLVAHNAHFDLDHISTERERAGMSILHTTMIDTLSLSRKVNRENKKHGLAYLSKSVYKVDLDDHHRATDDAKATAHIFAKMTEQAIAMGATTVASLNDLPDVPVNNTNASKEVSVWVQNETGLKNLYRLLSLAHTEYLIEDKTENNLARQVVIPRSVVEQYRDGLLIGSGSHKGQLFELALNKTPRHVAKDMRFYDIVEIQPSEIASHLWDGASAADGSKAIDRAWKTIFKVAKKLQKRVVATGFVHYTNPEDRIYHNIVLYNEAPQKGRKHDKRLGRSENQHGLCHMRTTEEMIQSFPWLPEAEAKEVVIEQSRWVFEQCQDVNPIKKDLFQPKIPHADEELLDLCWRRAKEMYGDPLPNYVQERLDKEIKSIFGNGYGVIYWAAYKLVNKSKQAGYSVGSRGSVGSSLVATLTGITEVNPLKPHYVCLQCHHTEWFGDKEGDPESGFDLPTKNCPHCEKPMHQDGHDIPFETFLGFDGDKVPDIDLNFSGDFQAIAHQYTAELFGDDFVMRAGTISTVADKTAYGFARFYKENNGCTWSKAEIERIQRRIAGVKSSTGQHPGGIIVVPNYMEKIDFCPYQYPANDKSAMFVTSHFDYHAIDQNLLKLDILGHDMPTVMHHLYEYTGILPSEVPVNDPAVMRLFSDRREALGFSLGEIGLQTGTLGLPEMGTTFVQGMLLDTQPKNFSDLLRISGLSHGTGLWVGNAKELIDEGYAQLSDLTCCRDDIMRYLLLKGVDSKTAFAVMESVRKGKGLKPEWEEIIRSKDIPDWMIEYWKRIQYMFPKAHAAAYVLDAIRVGWYKAHKPLEYYATDFSVRFSDADITELLAPIRQVLLRIKELSREIKEKKGTGQTIQKESALRSALLSAAEAKMRGVDFSPVRLYSSFSNRYRIEDGRLIAPFSSIPGIGPTVANALFEEAKKGPFQNVEDLRARTGADKNNIESLRALGCLEMIESKQSVFC